MATGTGSDRRVAIVRCPGYSKATKDALAQAFDLIGGIGSLVRDKTVAIKINLTGTNFQPLFGVPVGESFMTHEVTAFALASLLFENGARRVRFLESTGSRSVLESTLTLADWDLSTFKALGRTEFENTRNLGLGKQYSQLNVPRGGLMFGSLSLNHSYADTDVMVSLAKLKEHILAGITLTMKNLFGITPNSLYGDEAGSEEATGGRFPIHEPNPRIKLPGLRESFASKDPGSRIPQTVADICAARPIHLAIIDGISTMSGGEGPWSSSVNRLLIRKPGVLIVGKNPVSTDAVGAAVMGFDDPRAPRGSTPFGNCDNHLLLGEQAGLGTAKLSEIDVVGAPVEKVRLAFR